MNICIYCIRAKYPTHLILLHVMIVKIIHKNLNCMYSPLYEVLSRRIGDVEVSSTQSFDICITLKSVSRSSLLLRGSLPHLQSMRLLIPHILLGTRSQALPIHVLPLRTHKTTDKHYYSD
jgi:hypothetical protein